MVLGCPGDDPCTFIVEAWETNGTRITRYVHAHNSKEAREGFLKQYGKRIDTVAVKRVQS